MNPLGIIPTYLTEGHDVEYAADCIRSIRDTEPDVDILVVDDHSPEGDLVDAVEGLGVEVHRKEQNTGFARTVNVGLQRALDEGRDAILINADIEFIAPGWLKHMVGARTEIGPAAVVGGLLIYPNGTIQHAGIYFSLLTRQFDHRYKFGPQTLPEALKPLVCPVTGALQFIRHSTLDEVGIYDPAFCSPADEPILTPDGYVPIGELDPTEHGIVAVDHSGAGGRILRNGPGRGNKSGRGWPFRAARRSYEGDLICLQTAAGDVARVTPNHKLRVRWTDKALRSWAVYLMRRGSDWRIGTCAMRHGKQGASGPALRWSDQCADALWILGLRPTKDAALLDELSWSLDFQVPTALFRNRPGNRPPQSWLDEFWKDRDSQTGALRLLAAHGRDVRAPLLDRERPLGRGSARYVGGKHHGFLTHATNVMGEGLMTVGCLPTIFDREKRQMRREVAVDREPFRGDVHSLDVPPHRHYISGGITVHNSMGWEDVDYCLRVFLEAEKHCVYNPLVRAYHHESVFRGKPNPKIKNWQDQSFIYLMHKYQRQSFAGLVPDF